MEVDRPLMPSIANSIVTQDETILTTGANGFVGSKVVETLLSRGFSRVRCFVRPSGDLRRLQDVIKRFPQAEVELVYGNLLSPADCVRAVSGAAVVLHMAAGIEKSFAGCFMNSVVTTRNLLEAASKEGVKRFLNVSSFAVYSNMKMRRRAPLDEGCETERQFMTRNDAYCYGKTKQDEMVMAYGKDRGLPYVIVRPGVIYGPGAKGAIHSRIGIGTFGVFLHLGGSNRIPLAYIDNCADAIVLAGVTKGVDGQIFNLMDDDLPSSRRFLKLYKKHVQRFTSIYVPYGVFYQFCRLWESYSVWSNGQLPPVFNRLKAAAEWKGNRYSNQKLKDMVGWQPKVSTEDGMKRHFEYFKGLGGVNA
jgi:nucleoside-diphosphate-sugar epimerase